MYPWEPPLLSPFFLLSSSPRAVALQLRVSPTPPNLVSGLPKSTRLDSQIILPLRLVYSACCYHLVQRVRLPNYIGVFYSYALPDLSNGLRCSHSTPCSFWTYSRRGRVPRKCAIREDKTRAPQFPLHQHGVAAGGMRRRGQLARSIYTRFVELVNTRNDDFSDSRSGARLSAYGRRGARGDIKQESSIHDIYGVGERRGQAARRSSDAGGGGEAPSRMLLGRPLGWAQERQCQGRMGRCRLTFILAQGLQNRDEDENEDTGDKEAEDTCEDSNAARSTDTRVDTLDLILAALSETTSSEGKGGTPFIDRSQQRAKVARTFRCFC